MSSSLRQEFATNGFVGPLSVLDPDVCRQTLRELEASPPPRDWSKGYAPASRAFYRLGTHPAIVSRVTELLGEDVMLWGASLVRREPDVTHPWHTDIESSNPEGGTVTVWLGLENTTRESSLLLVSRSHRSGHTLQECAQREGRTDRAAVTPEDALEWAQGYDAECRLEQFDMGDGEALFFDGRLWHGSHNGNRWTTRTALLLQYATPDTPIRIPDFSVLTWPFLFRDAPYPPCIMVHGSGRNTKNKLVAPPSPERGERPTLSNWIEHLNLPLEADEETGWKPHFIAHGPTPSMGDLSCHASVLSPGTMPHDPHRHPEEELLIVLSGDVELVAGDPDDPEEIRAYPARSGQFVYYPAEHPHTIRNVGAEPATYLMFKWQGEALESNGAGMLMSLFDVEDALGTLEDQPGGEFQTETMFEGATRYLYKLHAHATRLAPGGGYDAHVDAYDVAILILSGTVETLGRRVGPNGVILYAAGEPHGMKNVGDTPATYLVFEFHGTPTEPEAPGFGARLRRRIPDPVRRVLRKMRSLVRGGR